MFVGERLLEVVDRPRSYGLPVFGAASDDKGGVFGDEAHKLEGTGFLVEFDDGGAVELVVRGDELGDGFVHLGRFNYRVLFKDLDKILKHFDQYPLISQKLADLELFRQAYILVLNKEHLRLEGSL